MIIEMLNTSLENIFYTAIQCSSPCKTATEANILAQLCTGFFKILIALNDSKVSELIEALSIASRIS